MSFLHFFIERNNISIWAVIILGQINVPFHQMILSKYLTHDYQSEILILRNHQFTFKKIKKNDISILYS